MVLASFIYVGVQQQYVRDAEARLEKIQHQRADNPREGDVTEHPSLPAFHSTQLPRDLLSPAEQALLATDEIHYQIDSGKDRPYLRYSASLAIHADYKALRRYLHGLQEKQPVIVLDGLSCARQEVAAPALECKLELSSYFAKEPHGH